MPTTPYGPVEYPGNVSYTITMPDSIVVDATTHRFTGWTDTDPSNTDPLNPIRTIYLDHNVILTAQYDPYFIISVNSTPSGVNFTITPV